MERTVVLVSCHVHDAGAVLGSAIGRLLPMAPWVVIGRLGGFVRGTFRFLLPPLPRASHWRKMAGRRARRTGRLLRVKCNAVWVDFRGIVVILSELLWSCCFRGAVGLPGWCGVHWVASVVK